MKGVKQTFTDVTSVVEDAYRRFEELPGLVEDTEVATEWHIWANTFLKVGFKSSATLAQVVAQSLPNNDACLPWRLAAMAVFHLHGWRQQIREYQLYAEKGDNMLAEAATQKAATLLAKARADVQLYHATAGKET